MLCDTFLDEGWSLARPNMTGSADTKEPTPG
jgi:hypothetical protein